MTEVAAGLTAGEETIREWIGAGRAALPVPGVAGGILELEAQDATGEIHPPYARQRRGRWFPAFFVIH